MLSSAWSRLFWRPSAFFFRRDSRPSLAPEQTEANRGQTVKNSSTAKPWYQSKTIQFNIGLVAAVVLAILAAPEFQAVLALLPEDVRRWAVPGIALLVAAINIYLRTVTSQPIGAPGPDEATQ
jgi:hypothetical protein